MSSLTDAWLAQLGDSGNTTPSTTTKQRSSLTEAWLAQLDSANISAPAPKAKKVDTTPKDTSKVLYTTKNGFNVTDNVLNNWLKSDYRMTDEDKANANEYLKGIGQKGLNPLNLKRGADFYRSVGVEKSLDYQNKNSALRTKASNKNIAATGFINGLVPFADSLQKKFEDISSDTYGNQMREYREGIQNQSPLSYGAGKALGTMAEYKVLNMMPIVGKGAEFLGSKLGGGKIAQSVGNILADTGVDLVADTLPELASNIEDGKSKEEIAKDALKNVAWNVGFNAGAEGLSQYFKAKKAAKNALKAADDVTEPIKGLAEATDAVKETDEVADAIEETAKSLNLLDNAETVITPALTNREIDEIITDVAKKADFEAEYGIKLNGTKAEQRKQIKEVLFENSEIPTILEKESFINNVPDMRTDLPKEEAVKVYDDNLRPLKEKTTRAKRSAKATEEIPLVDNLKSVDEAKAINDKIPTLDNVVNPQSLENNVKADINGSGNLRGSAFANGLERTNMPQEIVEQTKQNPLLYQQLTNKEVVEEGLKIASDPNTNALRSKYREMLSEADPKSIVVAQELVDRLAKEGDFEGASQVIEDISAMGTKFGQFNQAFTIAMTKSNPSTARTMLIRAINKFNKSGADKYKKWVDFKLTDEELKAFDNIAQGDTEAIQNLYEQITKRMAKSYPSTAWEKLVEATKTAMMLNPRTHIRNVAANTAMLPVRSISDRVSALGQNAYHLINPDFKVTQSLTGGTVEQKEIANKIFDDVIKGRLEGENKWDDVTQNAIKGRQVFDDGLIGSKGKAVAQKWSNTLNTLAGGKLQNLVDTVDNSMTGSVLENLRRFDYYLLGAVEDDPFVKKNFSNRLASYMKAQNIKAMEDVPQDAIELAYQEALKATFKDDNYMTKAFQGIKKSTGKFGEVVLPFVKTPANLAKRGIEYSPIGFVDTLMHAKGKDAQALIDELSKNAVGTAGIFLGYELAKKGLIQGALSSNKKEREFEKQQGKQAFSINVDGKYYTFDWAQPASIPLVIGTTIHDAIEESDQENANYAELAKQSAVAAVDAWADLSPLSSVQNILGGGEYSSDSVGENILNAIADFPQRLIPSASNATAKTADPIVRQTYTKGDAKQTWVDKAKAKIPGLSQTLPAVYDTWGREKRRQDNVSDAAFANFVNPGSFGYDASTPIDGEIQRLYNSTGSYSVFPNKAEWTITKGGESIKLDSKQYSEYQRLMGSYSYDIANALINSSAYASLDDSSKEVALKNIYSLAKSMAEKDVAGKEVSDSNKKMYEAFKNGGAEGVVQYLTVKNQISESIGNSKSGAKFIPVLDSTDMTVEEKGQYLAQNASATKATKELGDNYEALYNIFAAKAYATDYNNDGKINSYDYYQYLASVGIRGQEADDLIPYLK